MKQCFGYVRVSTQKQGEGVSLEAQRDAIQRFAGGNGITITRWFEEQQTAAKSGRPVFDAMLKELRAGKAAGVVMHKIDRSARNFFDWAKIGDLADRGIDVHFATESLDFRSRGGRLTANIQMAVAEDYVRNLRSEIKKGQRGLLERGYYPFSAPIGYSNNGKGKSKTPDPERAGLVRELFDLYATGAYSIRTLRTEMASRGLTNRSGRPPSKALIEGMLGNPFYTGVIKISATGKFYQGNHEPLISTTLFNRVQNVKAGKAGKKVTKHNHLYRGLFTCAHCGYSMIPECQRRHVYYRCQTRDCPTRTVREDRIEQAVTDALRGLRLRDEAVDRLVEAVAAWVDEHDGGTGNHLSLHTQMHAIDERMEKLTDAAIEKIIDAETFHTRRGALLIKKQQLENQAKELEQMQAAAEDVRRFLERVKSLVYQYEMAIRSEKRELVECTTSNRRVLGKSLTFEPSDWLVPVQAIAAVSNGAHPQPNSRRGPEYTAQQIEALVVAAYSEGARKFGAMCDAQVVEEVADIHRHDG